MLTITPVFLISCARSTSGSARCHGREPTETRSSRILTLWICSSAQPACRPASASCLAKAPKRRPGFACAVVAVARSLVFLPGSCGPHVSSFDLVGPQATKSSAGVAVDQKVQRDVHGLKFQQPYIAGHVQCINCHQQRVVFTPSTNYDFKKDTMRDVKRYIECIPFKCESPLVTHDIDLADKAFARQAVTCGMPITKNYYYGVTKLKFPNICVWCSSTSSLSLPTDTGTSEGKMYKLRPQCAQCIADGRPRVPHGKAITVRASVQSRAAAAATRTTRAAADTAPATQAGSSQQSGKQGRTNMFALFERRQRLQQLRGPQESQKEEASDDDNDNGTASGAVVSSRRRRRPRKAVSSSSSEEDKDYGESGCIDFGDTDVTHSSGRENSDENNQLADVVKTKTAAKGTTVGAVQSKQQRDDGEEARMDKDESMQPHSMTRNAEHQCVKQRVLRYPVDDYGGGSAGMVPNTTHCPKTWFLRKRGGSWQERGELAAALLSLSGAIPNWLPCLPVSRFHR